MSGPDVQVHTWPGFEQTLEKLERKYPRVRQDLELAFTGGIVGRLDALPGYSHKLWKYRVASQDMQRGKQGGFRVIFYMDPDPNKKPVQIYFLTIYAKSERADISSDELIRLWNRLWEHVKSSRQNRT